MSESTAEQRAEAVAAEYGKYTASEAIDIGGVRAFNVGDPVPISHVEGDSPTVRKDQVDTVKPATRAAATKES